MTDIIEPEVAETVESVEEPAETVVVVEAPAPAPVRAPRPGDRPIQTVGRRKEAIVRVRLIPGTGKITINGRDQTIYFARPTQRMMIQQTFDVSQRNGQFDVVATVSGGGLSGQAGAVRHGISQALTKFEPALRGAIKANGFLTRDSRVVERKKYGRAGARARFQFSKR